MLNKKNSLFSSLDHLDFFPAPKIFKSYNSTKLKGDLRGGFNVALLAFPQGMAYAAIAGLPIEYGVYASAVAAIVGPLLGNSKFVTLGPTNATSVLCFSSFLSLGIMDVGMRVAMIPLIVMMTGLFLVFGSLFKVANLTQFVSRSVVTGYITAASFYIIVNQVNKVLGYTDFIIPKGSTFLDVIGMTVRELGQTQFPTVALSAGTAGLYFILRKKFRALPNVAITLVAMTVAAFFWNKFLIAHPNIGDPVVLLKSISASGWKLSIPELHFHWINELASVSAIIAFLAILEGSSIGKSLSAKAGEKLNVNQEMYGMGWANIATGLLSGMPVSGSLTRSQLNYNSGAQSPVASIINGLLVVACAFLLGSYTQYIPKCVLAVLVIAIGLSLFNKKIIRVVIKSTQSDAWVFVITILAAILISLNDAIIFGTAASIILFLKKAAVPELVEYGHSQEGHFRPVKEGEKDNKSSISIVHVEGDLFFGATEIFRDQMRRVVEDAALKVVILKLRNAHHLDATSILALEELNSYMNEADRSLLISEARTATTDIFKKSGMYKNIGEDNFFEDDQENPTISTAKALKRARKIVGGSADVSIYVGTEKREGKKKK